MKISYCFALPFLAILLIIANHYFQPNFVNLYFLLLGWNSRLNVVVLTKELCNNHEYKFTNPSVIANWCRRSSIFQIMNCVGSKIKVWNNKILFCKDIGVRKNYLWSLHFSLIFLLNMFFVVFLFSRLPINTDYFTLQVSRLPILVQYRL